MMYLKMNKHNDDADDGLKKIQTFSVYVFTFFFLFKTLTDFFRSTLLLEPTIFKKIIIINHSVPMSNLLNMMHDGD